MLAKLAPGAFRHMMMNRLAELAQFEERSLTRLLAPKEGSATASSLSKPRATHGLENGLSPLRTGLKLLLRSPALAAQAGDPQRWHELNIRGIGLWISILELLRAHPHLAAASIIERWRDSDTGQLLNQLACGELVIPSEGYETEFAGIIRWLDDQLRDQRWAHLHAKSQREGLTPEEKREFVTLQQVGGNLPGVPITK